MIWRVIYNLLFFWVLTIISHYFEIKNLDVKITFYAWAFLIFNVGLFKGNRWKNTLWVFLMLLTPFSGSYAIATLVGEDINNVYNFYYEVWRGDIRTAVIYPCIFYMAITGLVFSIVILSKKKVERKKFIWEDAINDATDEAFKKAGI